MTSAPGSTAPAPTAPSSRARDHQRIGELDGWRGISILFVLAAHLLPLGPKRLGLNENAGLVGMSLFFTLSGYLITSFLIERPEVKAFFIRRILRIVPLAWLVLIIVLPIARRPVELWPANFFFVQNYVLQAGSMYTSHYWSLCAEMHFYVFVGLIVAVGGPRALKILPWVGLLVTAGRVYTGTYASIHTHERVDEILAGASLALVFAGKLPSALLVPLKRVPPWVYALLLPLSGNEHLGALNYFRPYIAALLVGSTMAQPEHWLSKPLRSKPLAYLATISYAVYVIHGPLRAGWFAEGSSTVRYLIKRPLTLLLTFTLAHVSTFYLESRWIALARRLTSRKRDVATAPATT